MPLGYSFAPTSDQAAQAKGGQVSPPFGSQGAIKTLNYSLPKVTGAAGAASISPQVTQNKYGSGITSAVLESVLRTVLGPDHAGMVLGSSPTPQNAGGFGGDDEFFSDRSWNQAPPRQQRDNGASILQGLTAPSLQQTQGQTPEFVGDANTGSPYGTAPNGQAYTSQYGILSNDPTPEDPSIAAEKYASSNANRGDFWALTQQYQNSTPVGMHVQNENDAPVNTPPFLSNKNDWRNA